MTPIHDAAKVIAASWQLDLHDSELKFRGQGAIAVTALSARNICAILLIVSSTLDLISNLMYTCRAKLKWFAETPTYLKWERGALIAAFVIAALGVALLEIVLGEAGETILARLGATAFLIGAVIAIVSEGQSLSGATPTSALEVIMVVVLFVAEAILGAALVTSGLLPAWVGRLDDGVLEHWLVDCPAYRHTA